MRPVYPLEAEDFNYFLQRFGIDMNEIDNGHAVGVTANDEYLFSVYRPDGTRRGHVLRQPWWKGSPEPVRKGNGRTFTKTLNFMELNEIPMSWYRGDTSKIVVVVEDQLSAMRISLEGYTSVALLGVNMSITKMLEIKQAAPDVRKVIFAPLWHYLMKTQKTVISVTYARF